MQVPKRNSFLKGMKSDQLSHPHLIMYKTLILAIAKVPSLMVHKLET